MTDKNLKFISMATAAFLSLSGCEWVSQDVSGSRYTQWQDTQNILPPPQTRIMQTADSTWLEPDRTPKAVPNKAELAELDQANKRIAMLEGEIEALRNDMAMMMPALTRLAGLESGHTATVTPVMAAAVPGVAGNLNNIQPAAGGITAAGEAQRIHQGYSPAQVAGTYEPESEADQDSALVTPPATLQQMAPPPIVPQQSPPVAAPVSYTPPTLDVTAIKNVRFGSHTNGKSRLVLDVTGARTFTYEIDNAEKILVLEVPGTVWNAGPVTRNIQDNPLVVSMASTPDGQGGTRLVFQLRESAQILWSQAIPPAGSQGHRIVLDLASL